MCAASLIGADRLAAPDIEDQDVWDGPWRRMSWNPVTGISEWHLYDPVEKKTRVRGCQEANHVNAVLEQNHALMTLDDGGWDKEKCFKRVGAIPLIKLQEFRNKGINLLSPEFEKERARFFNDSDHPKCDCSSLIRQRATQPKRARRNARAALSRPSQKPQWSFEEARHNGAGKIYRAERHVTLGWKTR